MTYKHVHKATVLTSVTFESMDYILAIFTLDSLPSSIPKIIEDQIVMN